MRAQPVHEDDWDYLVILDACRFDYFERLYSDYLDGELEKVRSRASSTQPWLWKTFPDEYEYSYLSTNPFVNGDDFALSHFSSRYEDWSAVDHFREVIDLWKTDWNEEKDTVLPEKVAEAAVEHKEKKPLIIHFVQPHCPYLDHDTEMTEFYTRKLMDKTTGSKGLFWEFVASVFHVFPFEWQDRLKKVIGIKRKKSIEKVVDEVGEERLKELYESNVVAALKAVKSLSDSVDGKVVVSADHGEMLGENGEYGHELFRDESVLREVPWFEADKIGERK